MTSVIAVARERNLFIPEGGRPMARQHEGLGGRAQITYAVAEDPNEVAVDA